MDYRVHLSSFKVCFVQTKGLQQSLLTSRTDIYIDYVLSLNNPKFGDYLKVIYPTELEVKGHNRVY